MPRRARSIEGSGQRVPPHAAAAVPLAANWAIRGSACKSAKGRRWKTDSHAREFIKIGSPCATVVSINGQGAFSADYVFGKCLIITVPPPPHTHTHTHTHTHARTSLYPTLAGKTRHVFQRPCFNVEENGSKYNMVTGTARTAGSGSSLSNVRVDTSPCRPMPDRRLAGAWTGRAWHIGDKGDWHRGLTKGRVSDRSQISSSSAAERKRGSVMAVLF